MHLHLSIFFCKFVGKTKPYVYVYIYVQTYIYIYTYMYKHVTKKSCTCVPQFCSQLRIPPAPPQPPLPPPTVSSGCILVIVFFFGRHIPRLPSKETLKRKKELEQGSIKKILRLAHCITLQKEDLCEY